MTLLIVYVDEAPRVLVGYEFQRQLIAVYVTYSIFMYKYRFIPYHLSDILEVLSLSALLEYFECHCFLGFKQLVNCWKHN